MESPETEDKLKENIAMVSELLNKQKLVEAIVHRSESGNQELVESLVHRQHLVTLQERFKKMHTGDIAHILEALPIEDRIIIWHQIKDRRGGDVLLEVSDSVRDNLIASLSPEDLLVALNQMDGDDLAYIADNIPPEVLSLRQETLTTEDQAWLRRSMAYEEDTVGLLMSNEMVIVNENDTLDQAAQQLRSLRELPIHNDTLFVVDSRGLLKGILNLQDILLNDPITPVHQLMLRDIIKFSHHDDAGESSQAFERYDLVSAPVVNERGKLIGRITVDVVMDYIRDETTEDLLNMAGISGKEDLFAPILNSAKNRGFWLFLNLFAAFFITRIIGLFEATISQLVSLAVLMPIVANIGGNIGNQTAALIIRGITLGQINSENTLYLVRKEMGISALNGIVIGMVVGLFSFILYENLPLSLVIAVAMLLTLVVAALLGLSVPLLLEKLGKDPALGSSVITTATVDSVGFFIFLGLASLFLT
ncbi:magnesium transporter [bacterium AH-315-L15]|nr:magnesium transporter [bacterium AH-315-L15]